MQYIICNEKFSRQELNFVEPWGLDFKFLLSMYVALLHQAQIVKFWFGKFAGICWAHMNWIASSSTDSLIYMLFSPIYNF